MNRPELVSTARDLKELKLLADAGADAFTIGHQKYGLRVTGDFDINDIRQAVDYLHPIDKKVFVVTNAILHNDNLTDFPDYLIQLEEIGVDGIICGDPTVFPILDEIDSQLSVFWNPETLATNYETLKYWQTKGIKRAILSNELALDAIIDIKNELTLPIEIQVHGMTCIFQSKRKLVTNYYNYIKEKNNQETYSEAKQLHLKQFKEDDSHYPVYEDFNGTHIMSNEDLSMIEYLQPIIDAGIDSVRINGLFKSGEYMEKIVSIYRKAIDLYCSSPTNNYLSKRETFKQQINAIQPKDRQLDTGFYFKEQIY